MSEMVSKSNYITEDGNKAIGRDPDYGHIREFTAALDENAERLQKALDSLHEAIGTILKPADPWGEPDSNPSPVRCQAADALARINDKLCAAVEAVNRMRVRVDI